VRKQFLVSKFLSITRRAFAAALALTAVRCGPDRPLHDAAQPTWRPAVSVRHAAAIYRQAPLGVRENRRDRNLRAVAIKTFELVGTLLASSGFFGNSGSITNRLHQPGHAGSLAAANARRKMLILPLGRALPEPDTFLLPRTRIENHAGDLARRVPDERDPRMIAAVDIELVAG
jgi:hypothetical protein